MKNINSLIIIIALSISFLVNSILLVSEGTRRTAEELKIINQIELQKEESRHNQLLSDARICAESGGRPRIGKDWTDCKKF
ncbi:hypothetical protein LCGC14_2175640 [marine sediment metagenome]|uniref:Uncharacterized protein n=1 Tax=marine sediment metagenome TaxID=412755 RepID=A0A0F9EB14_9ZZZZ